MRACLPKHVRAFSTSARKVYIAGHGVVPVSRKKEFSMRHSGATAISRALEDAGVQANAVQALYVGNMMSGMLSNQQNVSVLLATQAGLDGIETVTLEGCCGSGGSALRVGYMSIMSGIYDTVVVAGVEAMTHLETDVVTKGLATASDWEREGGKGATFVSLNGTLMQKYLDTYKVDRESFLPFAAVAHQNASTSPHALLKKTITAEDYKNSKVINPPVRLLDASPMCDGAAAVVLTCDPGLADAHGRGMRVVVAGSGAASDRLEVASRPDPLSLRAVANSTAAALKAARITPKDVDIPEVHDAYTIMACLSLEAGGFVPPGEGTRAAVDGQLGLGGQFPIATFGGLKARGHPVGATGVYQAAEMHMQLTGRAGKNQVAGAETALIQNISGAGSAVFAHILRRV